MASSDPAMLRINSGDSVIVVEGSHDDQVWLGQNVQTRKFGKFDRRSVTFECHMKTISKPVKGSLVHAGHGDGGAGESWGDPAHIDPIYLRNPMPLVKLNGTSDAEQPPPRPRSANYDDSLWSFDDDALSMYADTQNIDPEPRRPRSTELPRKTRVESFIPVDPFASPTKSSEDPHDMSPVSTYYSCPPLENEIRPIQITPPAPNVAACSTGGLGPLVPDVYSDVIPIHSPKRSQQEPMVRLRPPPNGSPARPRRGASGSNLASPTPSSGSGSTSDKVSLIDQLESLYAQPMKTTTRGASPIYADTVARLPLAGAGNGSHSNPVFSSTCTTSSSIYYDTTFVKAMVQAPINAFPEPIYHDVAMASRHSVSSSGIATPRVAVESVSGAAPYLPPPTQTPTLSANRSSAPYIPTFSTPPPDDPDPFEIPADVKTMSAKTRYSEFLASVVTTVTPGSTAGSTPVLSKPVVAMESSVQRWSPVVTGPTVNGSHSVRAELEQRLQNLPLHPDAVVAQLGAPLSVSAGFSRTLSERPNKLQQTAFAQPSPHFGSHRPVSYNQIPVLQPASARSSSSPVVAEHHRLSLSSTLPAPDRRLLMDFDPLEDGIPQELVDKVNREVPFASKERCKTVLKRLKHNVVDSVQELKVEKLNDMGLADKQLCRIALQRCNWNLEAAASLLLESG